MTAAPQPGTLALISAPLAPAQLARSAESLGLAVTLFVDAGTLLASDAPFAHDLYVVGGDLHVTEGIALIRRLRRLTAAGVLVWHGRAPCAPWLDAGADLWLGKGATEVDLAAALRAVFRRSGGTTRSAPAAETPWRLDRAAACLWTPAGIAVPLSDADLRLLTCFVGAEGAAVGAAALRLGVGLPGAGTDNGLHATVYRPRRRVERAAGTALPLATQARVGYVFRAVLVAV